MQYRDDDPVEEVLRSQENLLEARGGVKGLIKYVGARRPKWEKWASSMWPRRKWTP
jgi:hypothetical protein